MGGNLSQRAAVALVVSWHFVSSAFGHPWGQWRFELDVDSFKVDHAVEPASVGRSGDPLTEEWRNSIPWVLPVRLSRNGDRLWGDVDYFPKAWKEQSFFDLEIDLAARTLYWEHVFGPEFYDDSQGRYVRVTLKGEGVPFVSANGRELLTGTTGASWSATYTEVGSDEEVYRHTWTVTVEGSIVVSDRTQAVLIPGAGSKTSRGMGPLVEHLVTLGVDAHRKNYNTIGFPKRGDIRVYAKRGLVLDLLSLRRPAERSFYLDGTDFDELKKRVKTRTMEFDGATTSEDIIAHSMGGLVARWYIAECGGRKHVRKLIMLGTPNLGTPAAEEHAFDSERVAELLRLGLKKYLFRRFKTARAVKQMCPGSDFLRDLGRRSCRYSYAAAGTFCYIKDPVTREYDEDLADEYTELVYGEAIENDGLVSLPSATGIDEHDLRDVFVIHLPHSYLSGRNKKKVDEEVSEAALVDLRGRVYIWLTTFW